MKDHRKQIEFFVPGIAKTSGSKNAFRHPHTGKIVVTPACKKQKDWMDTVKWVSKQYVDRMILWTGPVLLTLIFNRDRPKAHLKTRQGQAMQGLVKSSSPTYPITMPDLTKLIRCTEDALKGIVWKDDSQVVAQQTVKVYCQGDERPGVLIRVDQLEEEKHEAFLPMEPDNLFDLAHKQLSTPKAGAGSI